jgi:hypothetical protein
VLVYTACSTLVFTDNPPLQDVMFKVADIALSFTSSKQMLLKFEMFVYLRNQKGMALK